MVKIQDIKLDIKTLAIILKDLPSDEKIEKIFLLGVTEGMGIAKTLFLGGGKDE